MSNIPTTSTDSADKTKKYFNTYFSQQLSFTSNQLDAVIVFFEKRGFEKQAAINVAGVLLQQAKIDNVKVFELLDTLKGYDTLELSAVVTQILNASRSRTSELGYKLQQDNPYSEKRNIPELYPINNITQINTTDRYDYLEVGYIQEGYVE